MSGYLGIAGLAPYLRGYLSSRIVAGNGHFLHSRPTIEVNSPQEDSLRLDFAVSTLGEVQTSPNELKAGIFVNYCPE
jgi:hypothetical protein